MGYSVGELELGDEKDRNVDIITGFHLFILHYMVIGRDVCVRRVLGDMGCDSGGHEYSRWATDFENFRNPTSSTNRAGFEGINPSGLCITGEEWACTAC